MEKEWFAIVKQCMHTINQRPYEAAKAYESKPRVFSESDLICVIGQSVNPTMCREFPHAAYRGRACGPPLAFSDENDPTYEAVELDLAKVLFGDLH